MKALLDNGAKLSHRSVTGTTCLMKAVGSRDIATVKLLLEAGADPHESTPSGLTALKIAESLQENDIIEILKKGIE